MSSGLERAADLLAERGKTVALTGAGISVESGIPDFRSAGGLWTRYPPDEYATLRAFRRDPARVWRMLAELEAVLDAARPNDGHRALAELEELGVLDGVVTQNVDGLHGAAGNRRVVEFHGSHRSLTCLSCGRRYAREDARRRGTPPACDCRALLKPDVVFFGEEIPEDAAEESERLARSCGVMLVVGTSAEVFPANRVPWTARRHGAAVVEVNVEPTPLTRSVSDVFLQGPAGRVLPALLAQVRRRVEAARGR